MSAAPEESRNWSPLKWVLVIGILFVLQAGAFVWLGRHKATTGQPPPSGVVVQIANGQAGNPGYDNPLPLVTPDANGFSRPWMQIPQTTIQPAQWTGQSNGELEQPVKPLAAEVDTFVTNTLAARFSVVDRPKPESGEVLLTPESRGSEDSTFAIRGELAGRSLISTPKLLPQYWDSLLSNSLVQIHVDAEGNVSDPPVVLPDGRSGSANTDAYAREIAQSLRFKPLPGAGRAPSPSGPPRLMTGTVVIRWRTEAPVPSNAPAANP